MINVALRDELGGRSPATLSRDERLEITRALDARGVFNIKRGMGQVAAALGVSRATAYACLQIVRAGTSGVANTSVSAPVGRPGRRRVASVSR